jgi:hypothetical protein
VNDTELELEILNGGTLIVVGIGVVFVETDAEVTVPVLEMPVEEMEVEVTVVVNERGGEGVTEGMVAVIVVVRPPEIVVVRVITSVVLVLNEEADVSDDVPVAREVLTFSHISPKAKPTSSCSSGVLQLVAEH